MSCCERLATIMNIDRTLCNRNLDHTLAKSELDDCLERCTKVKELITAQVVDEEDDEKDNQVRVLS